MPAAVILDACVLYPAPLRDVLLELSVEGIYRARWTERIHKEWMSNLRKVRPDLKPENLQRTRLLMDQAVPGCLVTGYEILIDGLRLPDPDDRHVLAAALVAGAEVIVTFNGKDFPGKTLVPYGIEARHPDEFLMSLLAMARDPVCQAIKRLRARLKKPPMTVEEYLACLERQGLPGFVAGMRKFAGTI